jgi:SAM-dependent methyltransferase
MNNQAEENVSRFYNSIGWQTRDGVTEDADRFEDLRKAAEWYVGMCRLRLMAHIPKQGHAILDMASGPIQYPEYLEYSRGYEKRYCVDLSAQALAAAKEKIGEHGIYFNDSFLNLEFADDFFDCVISLHTIYHMDKAVQEDVVRKLIRVVKVGHPVIVVYSNPNALIQRFMRGVRYLFRRETAISSDQDELYFYRYPLSWWMRFADTANVEIYPWRSFAANAQRAVFPNNVIGKLMFRGLFAMENAFPKLFSLNFTYPMIVLTKR